MESFFPPYFKLSPQEKLLTMKSLSQNKTKPNLKNLLPNDYDCASKKNTAVLTKPCCFKDFRLFKENQSVPRIFQL